MKWIDIIQKNFKHSVSIGEKIVETLKPLGICQKCIIRFLGIKDMETYSKINQDMQSLIPAKRTLLDTMTDAVEKKCTPCSACLGILQLDHSEIVTKSMDAFKKFKLIPGSTFAMSMRLPHSLAIRHRSIDLLLANQIYAFPVETIHVKEILRNLISNAFMEKSGMKFELKSAFCFQIGIEHSETDLDYEFMTEIPDSLFKIRSYKKRGKYITEGASLEKISKAVNRLEFGHFNEAKKVPPNAINTMCEVTEVSFSHESIYVAGRYCKLKRHISNSPWIINGKRLTPDSVEELIAKDVVSLFQCDGHRFSSAGREDADVRMLGIGRPFYLELINPKILTISQDELSQLQNTINNNANEKISVIDLQSVTKESTSVLKDSASSKSKSYSCLVKLGKKIGIERLNELSKLTPLTLQQRNPTRVPRRADIIREKTIESLEIIPIIESNISDEIDASKTSDSIENIQETDLIRINLQTSAGTYVKEFVHGDSGRTVPNIASLLESETAACLELDVLAVHLNWPMSLSKPTE